jgi:phosphoserine phosphatase RsbU/P
MRRRATCPPFRPNRPSGAPVSHRPPPPHPLRSTLRAVPLPFLPLLRRPGAPSGRGRTVLLWVAAAAGFAALLVYQGALAAVSTPPALPTRIAANIAVAASFGLLGYLIARPLTERPLHPIRAFWLPLVVGGLGLAAAAGLVAATGGPAEIDPHQGVPVGFGGALQVSGLALIEATVALVLLSSLRTLVMFKRTSASERNWRLMLGMMAAAALMLVGSSPLQEVTSFVPHVLLLVLAVLFMVANAFRLSWIVYLPFRQKLTTLGLAVGLIALLGLFLANRADAGWMGAFVFEGGSRTGQSLEIALSAVFSQPLSQFVTMAMAFGVLYAATALLALLFHLPTAGALEQKSGEMEALRALAQLSGTVFDRDRLVDTIAAAPVEAGVAQAAWLALVEPQSGSLRPRIVAARGLTPIQIKALTDVEALAAEVRQRGEPLLLRHAPADHRVRARPGDGIGSLLVLPVRAHEEDLGALFATRTVSDGFEADDVAALQTFAAQAALALTNADLFAERIERERLERELSIAREVQQRLLPQQLPCSPSVACAALSLPALEVAGDYYDVVDLGAGSFGVIVADVSGKGTSAAFYMAELKGIFQSVSRLTRSPKEMLVRANEALAGSLGRTAFISAVYAVVDEQAQTLTLARAGHCPVALARASGEVRLLRSGGLGLGLDRSDLFARTLEEKTLRLEPGDTLVLYTDGLVEARGTSGEEYGYERLEAALGRHHREGPEALRDALLRDLRRFTGRTATPEEESWEDDLTLVVVKWAGAPALTATPREGGARAGRPHTPHPA